MRHTEETYERFRTTFSRNWVERRDEVRTKGSKFAHYTSASNARLILLGREVWLRDVRMMNDFHELEHGIKCFRAISRSEQYKQLGELYENISPSILGSVMVSVDSMLGPALAGTYAFSVSEHDQGEDETGRLSMWRAYAPKDGTALVLNTDVFFSESKALGTFTEPVRYLKPEDAPQLLGEMLTALKSYDTLSDVFSKSMLGYGLYRFMASIILGSKHPGFREEKEWRVISTPLLYEGAGTTDRVESVRGVPQIIKAIRLENRESDGLRGLELEQLLDSVIIGPSQYPPQIASALNLLCDPLRENEGDKRVVVSDIPLRV